MYIPLPWHKGSDTPCQFDEWCEKPGERDSHKAVPIAVTPHRLIAAEVPFELSLAKVSATITLSVAALSVVPVGNILRVPLKRNSTRG